MTNIYDIRRYGFIALIGVAVTVVATFIYVSGSLVEDLSEQERQRMQIWADATKEIINAGPSTNLEFLSSIVVSNNTIPVLVTDDNDNILFHSNFNLPEAPDTLNPLNISAVNSEYLARKLNDLHHSTNTIEIAIAPGENQHLYYEDSILLKRLSLYPYVQLLVMLAFVAIVYYAVSSTKKAEQNKVWVGLSKETAHQLGTPISSLMAWTETLPDQGVDQDIVNEMNKDVQRLSTIASRFSKIGSQPKMEPMDIQTVVRQASDYMKGRISSRIDFSIHQQPGAITVLMSDSLFQWVMENLIKNAVDAMAGHGRLRIVTGTDSGKAFIEVSDSGKGIPRKRFKTVFNPGYTTKKRGWGLGLTLARRIIEEYHGGRIFVKESEPGHGTTFRIELPIQ
ncbi:MAG: HAMP domain-containing histidine kinase [Muribaculaceae bacterium]|nr:HAMP domain-containing histidine kinase [Muribaculaceae bacterium]